MFKKLFDFLSGKKAMENFKQEEKEFYNRPEAFGDLGEFQSPNQVFDVGIKIDQPIPKDHTFRNLFLSIFIVLAFVIIISLLLR